MSPGLMIMPSQHKRHASRLSRAQLEEGGKMPFWFAGLPDEERTAIRKAFAEMTPGETCIFLSDPRRIMLKG